MPRLRIEKLGEVGLNSDIAPPLLPTNVWTRFENCITEDLSIRSAIGTRKLFNLSIKPLYHTGYVSPTGHQFIVVSNGESVCVYDTQGVESDITPTVALTNGIVTFTSLNGILVVNSTSDGPFYWDGVITTNLIALPGWQSGWRCTTMVAFRYYLVALGMKEGINDFPHKVRWSNSAAEGELPTLWIAATSNDAGADLIGETAGKIIGGVLVRDALWIVKEDAVYEMRWIGGQYIMQLSRLKGEIGTKLRNGFAALRGSLLLFSTADLLVFDGQTATSIIDKRIRRRLFNAISEEFWNDSVVFVHSESSRIFIAGVVSGSNHLRVMLIYNFEEATWSEQILQDSYGFDSAYAAFSEGTPTWDEMATPGQTLGVRPLFIKGAPWDSQIDGSWNKGLYQPSIPDVLIYESNETDTSWWVSLLGQCDTKSDGTPITCIAERTGIPIEGADGLAMVTEVWPELSGNIPINISIGGMSTADSAPVWDFPLQVIPGITQVITPRVTGRFICVKIESNNIGYWRLGSLTVNWERAGER